MPSVFVSAKVGAAMAVEKVLTARLAGFSATVFPSAVTISAWMAAVLSAASAGAHHLLCETASDSGGIDVGGFNPDFARNAFITSPLSALICFTVSIGSGGIFSSLPFAENSTWSLAS